MKKNCIFLFLVILCNNLFSLQLNYFKSFKNSVGKSAYHRGNIEKATKIFQDNSVNNPTEGIFHFNLGNALYKSSKYSEALKEFQLSLNDPKFKEKDKIYHNIGNICFQNQEYKQALDSFRKSMVLNPENKDSRKNFELTLKKIQEQKNKSQNNDQNKNKDQKDSEKNKDNQKQEQLDQKKQDALNILKNIEEKEKEDLKRKKGNPNTFKQGKYW